MGKWLSYSTATTKQWTYAKNANRIVQETTNGTVTRNFTYDGAGNMLTGLPNTAYNLVYNMRNRPASLQLSGSTVATYYYNGHEQLVRQDKLAPLSPAGTTEYIYDQQGRLISELTGATPNSVALSRDYVWLDGMPIAVLDGANVATSQLSYVHVDHLMRPVRMTDASKATVWQALWRPNGTAELMSGTTTQNLRFPGQYYMIEQGLHYNWHRFYDPTTGTYTQPDPLGFIDGPSIYAYAGNNPVMFTDRKGLDILIIENGPTDGNPIGHTAAAVTGAGLYSSGNGFDMGSSVTDYLEYQQYRRNTTVYRMKTTAAQDKAVLDSLIKNSRKYNTGFIVDNCSGIVNQALDDAGLPGAYTPSFIPGSAGNRAINYGAEITVIPQKGFWNADAPPGPDLIKNF